MLRAAPAWLVLWTLPGQDCNTGWMTEQVIDMKSLFAMATFVANRWTLLLFRR